MLRRLKVATIAVSLLAVSGLLWAQPGPFAAQVQRALVALGYVTSTDTYVQLSKNSLHAVGAYFNFGAVSGTGGYGIRDNAGVIEVKNAAGVWTPFGAAGVFNTICLDAANQDVCLQRTAANTMSFYTGGLAGTTRWEYNATRILSTIPIYFPAGTAAAPSMAFASDPTAGFRLSSGGVIGVSTEGADRFAYNGVNYQIGSTGRLGFTDGVASTGGFDAFFRRESAAVLQMGDDAEGATNQLFKGPDRITSDGVGGNLTIAGGRNRGASAGGSIIFQTAPAAGAGVTGTLATRLTIDSAGLSTFTLDGLATTTTPAMLLSNATVAALGAQQYSPGLGQIGQGWSTNGAGASMPVETRWEVRPIQGAAAPTYTYVLLARVNNGAWSDIAWVDHEGTIFSGGTDGAVISKSQVRAGLVHANGWTLGTYMWSPVNGVWAATPYNYPTVGIRLQFFAAPTIASGFGTNPSIRTGSTDTFGAVDVGTGGTANSGVVTFNLDWGTSGRQFCVAQASDGTPTYAVPTDTTLTLAGGTAAVPVAWTASAIVSWHCGGAK